MLPFFSLRDMPDLCPKGIDLDMKPSAPYFVPYFVLRLCPHTWGSKLNKMKIREHLQEGLPWFQ